MRFESELFPRFNLAGMSGVFTGSRTAQFVRLRLWRLDHVADSTRDPVVLRWHHLQRTVAPDSDNIFQLAPYRPDANDPSGENAPLELELTAAGTGPDAHTLVERLRAAGFGLHACVTCRFWQPILPQNDEAAGQFGRCAWVDPQGQRAPTSAVEPDLQVQSALAPGCALWEPADAANRADTTPTSHAPDAPDLADAPQPRSTDARQPGLTRFLQKLADKFRGSEPQTEAQQGSKDRALERSGVGAGTEPCFACHGRLANLGALVVESAEGDPLTYSIWRCRVCKTTYLNRWEDRWVRTDSLETVERIYRVPPAQAQLILALIQATPGADHPQGRREREAEAATLETIANQSDLLSAQTKHGR